MFAVGFYPGCINYISHRQPSSTNMNVYIEPCANDIISNNLLSINYLYAFQWMFVRPKSVCDSIVYGGGHNLSQSATQIDLQ